jgi:hypothetical protein
VLEQWNVGQAIEDISQPLHFITGEVRVAEEPDVGNLQVRFKLLAVGYGDC